MSERKLEPQKAWDDVYQWVVASRELAYKRGEAQAKEAFNDVAEMMDAEPLRRMPEGPKDDDDRWRKQQKLVEIAAWVSETCLLFGSTPETAHEVAAIFVRGLRREWAL